MNTKSDRIYKEGPEQLTREAVHARFLALLKRDQDTGLSVPWKKALLEPPNPLASKKRPRLKLPVLLGFSMAGASLMAFVWFSFWH